MRAQGTAQFRKVPFVGLQEQKFKHFWIREHDYVRQNNYQHVY